MNQETKAKIKNEIEIFRNEDFGSVRTIIVDGEIWFVSKDIATILGYKDPKNTVKNRCKKGRVFSIPHPQNQNKTLDVTFIPESDVYRLIMGSKLESAQKFEDWVMEEIIPSIRKHGIYMTTDVIEKTLSDPDFIIQLATQLKEERQKRILAEQTVEEQKPLVYFANQVSDSTNYIDMNTMSKLIKKEGIDIGQKRLFKFLREKDILMSNNQPYQRYIENGYFKLKEGVYQTPYGKQTYTQTLVSGKGQIWITEQIRRKFGETVY